ncbi:MAG: LysM peptidoglycan-binding domain-containing protein [Candidatus Limnocylindrales bacterium]
MLPVVAAIVVLGASLVSFQPAAAVNPTGSVDAAGSGPRLAIGGGPTDLFDPVRLAIQTGTDATGASGASDAGQADLTGTPTETYASDGTLYKPVAVNTSVQDGSGLLETYVVKPGDTLTGIASRYGISMMTIWWANKLTAKDDLRIGQKLIIPPVSGLVVTVKEGDTLESLATQYNVTADDIASINELDDPNLIIGQILILPNAAGAPIPTAPPRPQTAGSGSGSGSCSGCAGPRSYAGGAMAWPVRGGSNYVSRGFIYGHYGLDIAATYGSRVVAAAPGTVIWAGWRNGGAGYAVWISNGSGLYTTYNHMSAILVSVGQSVTRGQQVGRIGSSGNSTGPHLHFEVWNGEIWNGGYRVSPRRYL